MQIRHTIPMLLIALPALAVAQGGGGGTSDLRVSGKFISDLPTGDPPLQVQSTTNVTNLSADKLDGFDVGDFAMEGSGVGVHYKNLVGLPGGEIDQDCAVNTGCFDGDLATFPVTISEPGYYRLVGNLETADPDQTIISIDVNSVLLDLNGFRIKGPASCSGEPLSCSSTGLGRGVRSNFDNVTVRDGDIIGMGSNGVQLSAGSHVEGIRAVSNGTNGIDISIESRVIDNIVRKNGQHGIDANSGSILTDNVATDNGTHGIVAANVRIVGNTASGNDERGISCGGKCLIRDNQADENTGVGIRAPDASVIIGNVVTDNNGDGIVNTLAAGTVLDNTVLGNDVGLNLRSNSGYARNVVTGNTSNVSGGEEVGINVCGSDTTCP